MIEYLDSSAARRINICGRSEAQEFLAGRKAGEAGKAGLAGFMASGAIVGLQISGRCSGVE